MKLLDRVVIAPAIILFALVGALARGYLETVPLRRVVRLACCWVLWLVLAALAADERTEIRGEEHIARGYADLPGGLRRLGARVWVTD